MKFTQEEISLCKQIAEGYEKEIAGGDWLYFEDDIYLVLEIVKTFENLDVYVTDCGQNISTDDDFSPLWTISDCLEFLGKKEIDYIFNFKHFKLGDWSFTAEDRKYKKVRGEGKTRLASCLKAVLAVVRDGK